MLSLNSCDKIVQIDEKKKQSGAKIEDVLSELEKHNLTLANFSSIKEQQISGCGVLMALVHNYLL